MLGSGVSLAPLSYKKVEHRDEILYYKSNHTITRKDDLYAQPRLYRKSS